MRDALFQGYAGAGFTHSSGGGLLEPADFHGMAALLIKDRVKGSKRRQQRALQRLMDPVKGNLLVQLTLTCLEREIASSQPTIPSCSTHPDSESDDDVVDGATLLNPPEFTGAAVSMLPPGDEAEAIIDDVPVIGSTISRLNNEESLHEAETTSANPTVEALTFPTLMNAKGGFRNTPSGCTHRHYIHKTFGSVAHHCARAQEVPATSMCIHALPPHCGRNCACFCRAMCRACKQTLGKGEVRIVTHAFVRPGRSHDFVCHTTCATPKLVQAMVSVYGSVQCVPMGNSIDAAVCEEVRACLKCVLEG